jgi:diguanylate cyclase (GGDEF)-like protein
MQVGHQAGPEGNEKGKEQSLDHMMTPEEAVLYHLTANYLSPLLPRTVQDTLAPRFQKAAAILGTSPKLIDWTNKVLWSMHWDGVLTSSSDFEAHAALLSTALYENRKVWIEYEGKDKRFQFNLFGLVRRDRALLVIGSYWQHAQPFVLTVRKIRAVQLTDELAASPPPDFDLQAFTDTQLNFPLSSGTFDEVRLEFAASAYSYVQSNPLVADEVTLTPPDKYVYPGYFALSASGVPDTLRLRQWLSGFGDAVRVLAPKSLRREVGQAQLDGRTNLVNAAEFERLLQREIARCRREPSVRFCLLLLDLDHFKAINDTHGHLTGDQVLEEVARQIRAYDAARYGGEEFAILLEGIGVAEAIKIAERIRTQIAAWPWTSAQGDSIAVTVSIGLTEFPDAVARQADLTPSGAADPDALERLAKAIMDAADQALYRAKQNGRNQVVGFSPKGDGQEPEA